RGVLDVVDTGDGVMAAHQELPRRRVGRSRLTEGETSELDEHHFNRDVAAACRGKQSVVERRTGESRCSGVRRSEVLELEVGLTEGADNAVLGGGAGINRQRHTGTRVEVIAEAISLAGIG